MNPSLRPSAGFSLVEVSMAIGIVAFAFLGIVALLPVGLKSVRESGVRNAVSMTERSIAESLRSAATADGTNFSFTIGNSTFTYQLNTPQSFALPPFTATGTPALHGQGAVAARLDIEPPASRFAPARAVIRTAWPSSATFSSGSWQGAEGSASSAITFFPR